MDNVEKKKLLNVPFHINKNSLFRASALCFFNIYVRKIKLIGYTAKQYNLYCVFTMYLVSCRNKISTSTRVKV